MTACVHSRPALRTLPRCAEGLAARFLLTVSVQQQITTSFSRRLIMTRISVLLFLSIFCFATAMQAQAPAPKPDPEVKKLLAAVGLWKTVGS